MNKCSHKSCHAENPDDAIYCHMCGKKLETPPLNANEKHIIDIIGKNMLSNRLLSAFRGKQNAILFCVKNKIKTQTVDDLMKKCCPDVLEKSNLGKQFLLWIFISLLLAFTLYGIPVSLLLIWFQIRPIYKELKSKCI